GSQAEAVDKLHDDVEQPTLAAEVIDAHDGGVVQTSGGAGFVQESLLEGRIVGQFAVHDLDGHRPHQVDVGRPVDGSHAAFADDAVDAIVFDLLIRLDHGAYDPLSRRSWQTR